VIKIFNCPKCGNECIRSYGADKIKLRTNIVIFEIDKATCKCLKCKSDVEIPVFLKLPTGRILPKDESKKGKKT
jgi:hypothetical protein